MIIDSAKDFLIILKECDAESLYEAARQQAQFHENYLSGKWVSIDKTSLTIMEKIQAQTKSTPADQIAAMRQARTEAIQDFCYMYGGYIALKLKLYWEKHEFRDIVEKNEYISLATEQVVKNLINNLQKNGYRQGTFSHLVHQAIKKKSYTVAGKYKTLMKNNGSLYNVEDIADDVDDIPDDNSTADSEFEVNEKELEVAGILNILKNVETKNSADDYNMFILYHIEKQKLTDIAEKFDISIATASRRIKSFGAAAFKLYKQEQQDMEKY